MEDVGERDIDEVIAETRKQVADLQEVVKDVQGEESGFDSEIADAKKAYDVASAKVEDAKMKEAVSFEKVKATREAAVEAKKQTSESQTGRGDVEKTIALLELEAECKTKIKELREAKE